MTCAAVVLARQSTPAPQQTPPPEKGTAVVTGQVVDANGDGVPAAVVILRGGIQAIALTTTNRDIPGGPRPTITTKDGHFAFFDLLPGTYTFDATKQGFIDGAYGRLRPNGLAHSIDLKDGEVLASIRIPIWEYASVAGTVRDETGEPVVGVQVRALRRGFVNGRSLLNSVGFGSTNDRGEYRIDTLPPGRYVIVVASTQTSLPAPDAASRAAGAPAPDPQLTRSGIFGTGIGRQLGDFLWNWSGRSAMVVPNPTDDGRMLVYPTTFYPSARSSREAEAITLESGGERLSVDLQLQLVPATIVSGVLMGANGPADGLAVRLVPEYADDLSGETRGMDAAVSVSDANGRFFFAGVPVGRYYLQAEASPAPPGSSIPQPVSMGWLNEPVAVGEGGLTGGTHMLRPAVKVSGKLFFDGTKPPPPPEWIEKVSVSLEALDFAVNRAEAPYLVNFDRNGQFVFPSVPPGRYTVLFRAFVQDRRAMPDWETKGATLDGKDVSDRPMVVTTDVSGIVVSLTDRSSQVSGAVRDSAGKADSTAAVILFTAERELWPVLRTNRRIRLVRASENGTYVVRGVPAGQYFVAAISDADVGDFWDPQMLEALSKVAASIVMAPAEQKTQDLVLKSVK